MCSFCKKDFFFEERRIGKCGHEYVVCRDCNVSKFDWCYYHGNLCPTCRGYKWGVSFELCVFCKEEYSKRQNQTEILLTKPCAFCQQSFVVRELRKDKLGHDYVICAGCIKQAYDHCSSQHWACVDCKGGRFLGAAVACRYCGKQDTEIKLASNSSAMQFDDPFQLSAPSAVIQSACVSPHQTGLQATVSPPDVRLGVITWNVAHFSKDPINLNARLMKARDSCQALYDYAVMNLDKIRLQAKNEAFRWKARVNDWTLDREGRYSAAQRSLQAVKDQAPPRKKKGDDDPARDQYAKKLKRANNKLKAARKRLNALGTAGVRNWLYLLDTLKATDVWDDFELALADFTHDWHKLWDEKGDPRSLNPDEAARDFFREKRVELAADICELRTPVGKFFMTEKWRYLRAALEAAGVDEPELFERSPELLQVKELATTANAAVVDLDRALHKILVVENIVEIFQANDTWLDVLILQEVNDFACFSELLIDYANGKVALSVTPGPGLESKSGERTQKETYPIVCRNEGSRPRVRITNVSVCKTGGALSSADTADSGYWSKKAKTYRPIVVYEATIGSDDAAVKSWIGVVHTSPAKGTTKTESGTRQFERAGEFKQIEKPLETLLKECKTVPVLVGGDYYLFEESKTISAKDLTKSNKVALKKRFWKDKEEAEKQLGEELPEKHPLKKFFTDSDEWYEKELLRQRNITGSAKTVDPVVPGWHVTVGKKLTADGWLVLQSVGGTNFEGEAQENEGRIADFFLSSQHWKAKQLGLLCTAGGIVQVDTKKLTNARYWTLISDHLPVGGCFSTRDGDVWVNTPLNRDARAQRNADIINAEIEKGLWGGENKLSKGKKPRELFPLSPGDFEPQSSGVFKIDPKWLQDQWKT